MTVLNAPARPALTAPTSNRQPRQVAGWLLVGLAAAAWVVAMPLSDVERIDGWGLLSALSPVWFASFVLTLAAYVVALRRDDATPRLLVACQVMLVLLLSGTTAVLYGAPRYPWTQKHIGVASAILSHGLHRSTDIYDNYPGFFLLAGAVHAVTRISFSDLARWAEVAFALASSGAALFAFRGLRLPRSRRWQALLLLTLGNWIGQGYFAPQALAYVLALVIVGGLLRRAAGTGWWAERGGAVVLAVLFLALAASHQLTPFAVLAQAGLLWVFGGGLRWRWPVVFTGILAAWTATAWPYLRAHGHVLQFGLFDSVRAPGGGLVPSLPGARLVQTAGPALVALLGCLAALAVVRAVRGSPWQRIRPVVLLAVAPVGVLAGQAYGNEGVLRVYLLALPWLSVLIVTELLPAPRGRRVAGAAGLVGLALVGTLAVPAAFALELVNHVDPSEVSAAAWFETHTPAGAPLVVMDGAAPTRSTDRYALHVSGDRIAADVLSDDPGFRVAAKDPQDLENFAVDACLSAAGDGPGYLLTGPGTANFGYLYGLFTPATYAGLLQVLGDDPDVTLAHRSGDSAIWTCSQ